MKLFQIEEPDGSPLDSDMPGAAIGIDASAKRAEVGFAIGGNAALLADREGFERELPVPALDAPAAAWQTLFEGARLRAERNLARPVTHATLGLAREPDNATVARLSEAARQSGLELLTILQWSSLDLARHGRPAEVLAALAEDLAPVPKTF